MIKLYTNYRRKFDGRSSPDAQKAAGTAAQMTDKVVSEKEKKVMKIRFYAGYRNKNGAPYGASFLFLYPAIISPKTFYFALTSMSSISCACSGVTLQSA